MISIMTLVLSIVGLGSTMVCMKHPNQGNFKDFMLNFVVFLLIFTYALCHLTGYLTSYSEWPKFIVFISSIVMHINQGLLYYKSSFIKDK